MGVGASNVTKSIRAVPVDVNAPPLVQGLAPMRKIVCVFRTAVGAAVVPLYLRPIKTG